MTTQTASKWFYPLQTKAEEKIAAKYSTSGCNWQEITKDKVIECYECVRNSDKKYTTIIVIMYRYTGSITINEFVY